MGQVKTMPTLDMVKAIQLAAGRLLDFKGRSRRSEFWWWMAVVMIVQVLIGLLLGEQLQTKAIVNILIMCCGLSVTVRRLQDSGNHAIWLFLSFGFGVASNIYYAFSKMALLLEEYSAMTEHYGLKRSEAMVDQLLEKYSGVVMVYGGLYLLWLVFSLVVIVMCLLDSKAMPNKYGPSPKYIMEEEPQPIVTEKTDL